MSRIRTICLLALCLTCSPVYLQAQEDVQAQGQWPDRKPLPREIPSPEKQARRLTDRMNEELQLSDKQYKKLYKLNLKEQKKRFAMMNSNQGQRPPMDRRGMDGERPPMGLGGMAPGMGTGMGGGRGPMGPPPSDTKKGTAEDLQKEIARKEKKIKKILTDEQYAKWQMIDQRKDLQKDILDKKPFFIKRDSL